MREKIWNLLQPPPEVVENLSASLNISPTLARILSNRQIRLPEEADHFLNPSLDRLHDPFLMRGMSEAVRLLTSAIRAREKILVYGDYDVDGVTGTTLLVSVLTRFTDRVSYDIPLRIEDGYGLQSEKIRHFAAENVKLILTVDCGISNATEIEEGRALGISFIVTDHHEPPAWLPAAEAILNPRQAGCPYPDKNLAGVGIAFKLGQAVWRQLGGQHGSSALPDNNILDSLDLVAMGTVADVAPLRGENRILVKHGLEMLNRTSRVGLQALKKVSGLHSKPLNTGHISYALGPRINAAGRLGRAVDAVDLLLEDSPVRAATLAGRLNLENQRRQQIEIQIRQEAFEYLKEKPELLHDVVIVISSPEWHPGVIGIVASKLADRYLKPAILISTREDPGKGSGRSVTDFNLFSKLRKCRHLLETFGGHHHAAGFSIKKKNIPLLRGELRSLARQDSESGFPSLSLDIDDRLDFRQLRSPFFAELRRLMPYGSENREPTFTTERVFIARPPRTVGTNHLRLALRQKPHVKQAIGFQMGHFLGSLSQKLAINVAYSLDLDPSPPGSPQQLRLCDIQLPYYSGPTDAAP